MALNQQPGTQDVKDPTTGNYDALPPRDRRRPGHVVAHRPGRRARFLIPSAALENAAGKYVEPTDAAMAAAVKDMTIRPGRHHPADELHRQGPGRLPDDDGHLRDRADRRDIRGQGRGDRQVPRLRGHQRPDDRRRPRRAARPATCRCRRALRAADAQGRHRGTRPGRQPEAEAVGVRVRASAPAITVASRRRPIAVRVVAVGQRRPPTRSPCRSAARTPPACRGWCSPCSSPASSSSSAGRPRWCSAAPGHAARSAPAPPDPAGGRPAEEQTAQAHRIPADNGRPEATIRAIRRRKS